MLKGQQSFLYLISSFFWLLLGKELPRAKQQRSRRLQGTGSLLTSPSLGTNVHMVDAHALSQGMELYLENTHSVCPQNLLYSFLRKINTLLVTDRIERTKRIVMGSRILLPNDHMEYAFLKTYRGIHH